jgi:hypothetical protein
MMNLFVEQGKMETGNMAKDHLIITQEGNMKCLCCGDEYPLVRARIQTIEEFLKAFTRVHDNLGCTEEKYLARKISEDA